MSEWISVKAKLPEEGVYVLTIDIDSHFPVHRIDYIIILNDDKEPYLWACRLVDEWNKVTHWMPLPKAPNE